MKNNLVVKHNDLIEARYNLTLNEQRVILYSVSMLNREKEDFETVKIKINELTNLLDTTEKRYTEFRTIAENLIAKTLYIKKGNSELVTSWLSSMEYIKNEGIIELEFSRKLIPYLLQLKEKFTRYELENILYFKNKHSIRVYELMKQYEKIGKREINLEDLRKCLGILEDEYLRFSNLESRVLKTTKEEINRHTDINIDYEKIKTGRRITSILFKIESKDQNKEIYIDYLNEFYNIKEMKLKMGLQQENFSTNQIMSVYEKAVEKAGNEDIDLFEYVRLNYNHIKANARNKFAYLLKALENDYASAIGQISLNYYIEKENN